MATFKEIRGQLIRKYTTNPANPLEGQMWYNSTTGTLKGVVMSTAAWVSGGGLNNATRGSNSAFGSTPAGVMVGGTTPTGPITANTELYDGTSWTANPNACPFNIGYGSGGGPQTAGIVCSGENPPGAGKLTAEFDGSTWTGAPGRATSTQSAMGIGTQTSFIHVGGEYPPSWTALSVVETFNGASWTTEPNSYPAGLVKGFAGGTAAAAVVAGGTPNPTRASNTWDGSSWTAAPVLSGSGERYNGAYAGTSTDAFAIGGYDTPSGGLTDVDVFDGTTWAATASTTTGTSSGAAAGQTGGPGGVIKMGGAYGTDTTCEEFEAAVAVTETVTTS